MLDMKNIIIFSTAALVMVLTPGSNMIYLISRSLCQGKVAGIISLLGIICGFIFYMLAATFGLTAIFLTIPHAYEVMKILGAMYLTWLAWKSIFDKSPLFTPSQLTEDRISKLFSMGFITNILNPKAALFYMALFPQFIKPDHGSIILQSLFLGSIQITISFIVNCLIVLTTSMVCTFINKNPLWAKIQKWIMGLTLGGLAVRLILKG